MTYFNEAPLLPAIAPVRDFADYREAYRAEVPNLERWLYLNHASAGPLSNRVVAATALSPQQQQMAETCNQDPWFDGWRQSRQRVGELIGANRDEICIQTSTYDGLARAFDALPLGEGDEVLMPADEFPSLYFALSGLRNRGCKVVEVPSGRGDGITRTADLLDAITPRTKLVATSWVVFLHGYVHDVKALGEACRERGIWYVLDVIQGLGQLTLDVKACGAHFVSGQGAKWLCAPLGSGFLYVSREVPQEITPRQHGWFAMELNHDEYTDRNVQPKANANRFATGTVPHANCYGLRAACEVFLEAGPQRCEVAAVANGDRIAAAAIEAGIPIYTDRAERRCAIVSLDIENHQHLPERLRSADATFSVRNGKLRLSPHWYQTEREISRACDILTAK